MIPEKAVKQWIERADRMIEHVTKELEKLKQEQAGREVNGLG